MELLLRFQDTGNKVMLDGVTVVSVCKYNDRFDIVCVIALSGLVHKSEMSACRVEKPGEIVDVGENVWIKVIGREVNLVIMYANTITTAFKGILHKCRL